MRNRFLGPSVALLASILFLSVADLRAQSPAPADTIDVNLTTTLDGIETGGELPPGTRIAVACPAGARAATIWGTGTYTSDSALCVAATHAGALSGTDPGIVIVEVAPGLQAYEGTIRHGIASTAYPAWSQSFRFPDATEPVQLQLG